MCTEISFGFYKSVSDLEKYNSRNKVRTRLKPKKLMRCITKWQTGLDWNAVYFENHDQPRFVSRFMDGEKYREKTSMMMAGLIMTLRGTPYVYEGQEIGMTNGDFASLDEIEDIESHNIYKMATSLGIPKGYRWKMITRSSRDNGRTPMQWTAGKNAGFTTGKPWLKINGNHTEVNVERELAREDGVLAFWRYMIKLRREMEVLMDGAFVPLYESNRVYAFERRIDGEAVRAVFNMSAKNVALPRGIDLSGELVASNYDTVEQTLRPFEFRLVRA